MPFRTPAGAISFVLALLVSLALVPAGPASAETLVFPHMLEKSGGVSSTPHTFDTQIFVTYSAGWGTSPPGTGVAMDLYLFDQNGDLAADAVGSAICGPCTFPLGSSGLGLSASIEDLFGPAGLPGTDVQEFFATAEASGDTGRFTAAWQTSNSNSSVNDLSVFVFEPREIAAGGGAARTFVIPHVLEQTGTVYDTPFTFDTTLFMTYVGGLAGTNGSAASSATVDVYLFDENGATAVGGTGTPLCAPCSFPMGDGSIHPRKRKINIETLLQAPRGLGGGPVPLIVYTEISGDADHCVFYAEAARSQAAGDFHVRPLPIHELGAATPTPAPPGLVASISTLSVAPNPAGPATRIAFELTRPGRAELSIYDVSGRRVRALSSEVLGAGRYDRMWDGRNDDGLAVADGVYFAQLVQGGVPSRAKITVRR